jgi:RHS repeat-associated protein
VGLASVSCPTGGNPLCHAYALATWPKTFRTRYNCDVLIYMYDSQLQHVSFAYKFTGKERDAESSLDMFGARYYGSSLGRFMTPDWAAKPVTVPYAHFANPQSLNLYSYVNNNPTTTADPDGHCPGDIPNCSKMVNNPLSSVSSETKQAIPTGSSSASATTSHHRSPPPWPTRMRRKTHHTQRAWPTTRRWRR